MIQIKNISIFDSGANILAHQTNCIGVMGGLAGQFKRKYPSMYSDYRMRCMNGLVHKGDMDIYEIGLNHYIANLFGQDNIVSRGSGDIATDYSALRLALLKVEEFARLNNLTIALPYNMGCDLGGGNWNIVYSIIVCIFEKSPVKLTLCKYTPK